MHARSVVFALALAAALPSRVAAAADVDAAREAARPLAREGIRHYDAKRYGEAIAMLEKAEALFHAPTHQLFIARARVKLGQLVAGAEAYRRLVAEKLANYAPKAFRDAQEDAARELDELDKRLPRVRLTLHGPSEGARLRVDERWYDEVPPRLELDPGAHVITVLDQAGASRRHKIELSEGDDKELTFELAGVAGTPETAGTSPLRIGSYAAFGAAGVATVAGIATAVAWQGKLDDLNEQCPNQICPSGLAGTRDAADRLGAAATASFVIAGLAAAAGATLLVLDLRDDGSEGASLRLLPGGAALRVRF